jgi:hypothetical protein
LEKGLKYKYLGNIIEASGKFHSTHIELSKRVVRLCFPCLNTSCHFLQFSLNLSKDFCRPSALSDRSKMSSANMRKFKDSVSNATG